MLIEPELDWASVVLIGNFNPAIFQPQWFGHHKLVSPQDADEAQIAIIHPEITKFTISKFELSVESNRLISDVTRPPFVDLADLIQRVFRELLPHTPIYRMGINRHTHFSVGTEEARNNIGVTLAPHGPWGEWSENLGRPMPNRGGLHSMTMQELGLDDRPSGFFRATVQPSSKIASNTGIYMSTNDDYDLGGPDKAQGSEPIMDLLATQFDTSMKRAEGVINQIMSLRR